jgi:hypothetical protein
MYYINLTPITPIKGVINIEELINLIVNNSMSVVIIAYFLYKDYKFNEQIISVLGEIKEVLSVLKEKEDIE